MISAQLVWVALNHRNGYNVYHIKEKCYLKAKLPTLESAAKKVGLRRCIRCGYSNDKR